MCTVVEEWNPTNVTGVPTTTVLIHVNNERGGAKLSTRPAFLIHEPVRSDRSCSFFSLSLYLSLVSFCSRATRNKYKREPDEKSRGSSIFVADRNLSIGSIFAWWRERSDMYTIIRPNKFLLPPSLLCADHLECFRCESDSI